MSRYSPRLAENKSSVSLIIMVFIPTVKWDKTL